MKLPRLALTVAPALLAAGCIATPMVWTRSYNFGANTWAPESRITFTPDTTSLQTTPKTCVLSLRYGSNATAESIRLVVETESPEDGYFGTDTVTVRLLPERERTGGNGRVGVFETNDTLKLSVPPAPGWNVTVFPAEKEEVAGLFSITLTLYN